MLAAGLTFAMMLQCPMAWPNSAEHQAAAPANAVIWVIESQAGEQLELQPSENRQERVRFDADRDLRIHGVGWIGFSSREPLEQGCYELGDLPMTSVCADSATDDEAPNRPTVRVEMAPRSYGTSGDGSEGEDQPAIFNCPTQPPFSFGNMTLNIETDEPGPVIAVYSVKTGDQLILEDALFLQTSAQIRRQVPDQGELTVEVRIIDQAGQTSAAAAVTPERTEGGCYHLPPSLWLLGGLWGLRRRRV
jgi:hypothetical protein